MMGLMGMMSTPMMVELGGMNLAATWHHPPGAAQRSISTVERERKSKRLFSWISLNADRAR